MLSQFGRFTVCSWVAAAMLAGCGGHTDSDLVPVSGAPNSVSGHRTFKFTGTKQIFEVPHGVTQIRVIALGANGAGSGNTGYGGRVSAVIPVTYLDDLVVVVGGVGSLLGSVLSAGMLGEINGVVASVTNDIVARAVVFGVVILIIVAKPKGLFSFKER